MPGYIQEIANVKGAFGYDSTDAGSGQQRQHIALENWRNMSTANSVEVGKVVAYSSLIGEGNEAKRLDATGDIVLGVAFTSASTNDNTTNVTTNHPDAAWATIVTYGPVDAAVSSAQAIQKGETLVPTTVGEVAPLALTSVAAEQEDIVGWALTSAATATTNVRIFVNPQRLVGLLETSS